MKNVTKIMGIALTLTLTGCTQTEVHLPTKRTIVEKKSPILTNLNGMLKIFHGKPLTVAIANLENETAVATLPSIFNTIAKRSFNDIGDMVHVIADIENYSFKGGDIYTIHGAITQFDVTESIGSGYTSDLELGKGRGESIGFGALDKESKTSQLAITFNPENPRTGLQVSRCSVSNTIKIYQKSNAHELGFSIFGSSLGVNKTITKSQGLYTSIVILVDVDVVEVLGKLTKVPYWILTKKRANREIVNQLTREFIGEKPYMKLYKISYLLTLRGYYSHTTSTIKDNGLKEAIINYKKIHGMRGDISISRELYRSLLEED